MKNIFDRVVDDSPYTHPMHMPVTAFGAPIEHTKTPSIAVPTAEGERAGERIVKERRVSLLGFPVIADNSTK